MHQPQFQRREILIVISLLLVTSLACSLGGSQSTATQASPPPQPPQGTPLAQNAPATQAPIAGQPTLTSAPAALPTETPLSGTGPGGCVLNAAFVADLTIPDNTIEAPGTAFIKSWRVKNTGTCTWDASYQLVFAEGNQMSGPASVPINPTAPGANVDLSISLTAPTAPSSPTYIGKWRLKASNAVIFGGLTVIIVVPAPPAAPTATATTAPTAGPPITLDWPLVRQGDTGAEVFALQYILRYQGSTITADGIFGANTRKAVIDFQFLHGLTQDGIVGPNTWSALTGLVLVSQGSSNEVVRAAQYLLHNKFGYPDVAVDGIFGPKSDAAVRDFQTKHGLNADGIIGPKTWKALVAIP